MLAGSVSLLGRVPDLISFPRACCLIQRLAGGLTWNELKEFLHALHPTREADITEGEVSQATQGQADRQAGTVGCLLDS